MTSVNFHIWQSVGPQCGVMVKYTASYTGSSGFVDFLDFFSIRFISYQSIDIMLISCRGLEYLLRFNNNLRMVVELIV